MSGPGVRAVKAVLKRALARFGLYLGRFPRADTLEQHLAHLFGRLRVNCVFDVGAHHGEYAEDLRGLGYQGRIVSFEPVPENFAVLAGHAQKDGRWQVRQLALADRAGGADMNVLGGSTFSSLLEPNEYGRERFGDKMAVARSQAVPVARLEDVFDECLAGLDRPRVFLKADTQGYDLEVLRGAGSRLDQVVGLQVELSVKPIYRDVSTSFGGAVAWLQERGFELTGLFPVTWERDGLRVIEYDCVMCRPDPDALTSPAPGAAGR
jgi:FkbM family methyltransferase